MNVLVRAKRSEKVNRRRSEARAIAAEPQRRTPAPGRSRRDHGPLQDNALYTCHCGFVFQAAVTTTVDCPHCGSGQAW